MISVYRHAVVITPVARWALIARGMDYSNLPCTQRRRPSPSYCKVGDHISLFEACSTFTRVTACTLAESLTATLCTSEGSPQLQSPNSSFPRFAPLRRKPTQGPGPASSPAPSAISSWSYHNCSNCYRQERKLPGGHHSPRRNCAFHGALEVGLADVSVSVCCRGE